MRKTQNGLRGRVVTRSIPAVSTWGRWARLVPFLLMVALASCGSDNGPGETTADSSDTSSESPSACVEESAIRDGIDDAASHLENAASAVGNLNTSRAATELRVAASDARALADLFAEVDPQIQSTLLRAADALDNAATALSDLDLDSARSYMAQGANDLQRLRRTADQYFC